MSVDQGEIVHDRILEARLEVDRTRGDLEEAREALLEVVRQRGGNGGPAVIAEVAEKSGLDPATVQQSLWELLASRQLFTDTAGSVVASLEL